MAKKFKNKQKNKRDIEGTAGEYRKIDIDCGCLCIVIAVIMHWESVMVELSRLIKVLMPFILGIVLAF